MSYIRTHGRVLVVAICCVALGAGASAIASAGAATNSAGHSRIARQHRRLHRFAAHVVQGTFVVHTRHGFATVKMERGTVDSVSGRQLTLTEGTPKASYKTITLTIPSTARVHDNRQLATLSDVKPGQRVIVVQGPKRTFVFAHARRH